MINVAYIDYHLDSIKLLNIYIKYVINNAKLY